jgi:hypothetical protein
MIFDPFHEAFEILGDPVAAQEFADEYARTYRALKAVHPQTAIMALAHLSHDAQWSKRFVTWRFEEEWHKAEQGYPDLFDD